MPDSAPVTATWTLYDHPRWSAHPYVLIEWGMDVSEQGKPALTPRNHYPASLAEGRELVPAGLAPQSLGPDEDSALISVWS